MKAPLVIKFGGTSVGDGGGFSRAARIAAEAAQEGPVAVVVSAMSGTTDILLGLATAAAGTAGARGGTLAKLRNSLADRHLRAAREAVPEEMLPEVEGRLHTFLGRLEEPAVALTEGSKVFKDTFASLGERLSAEILAGAIAGSGTRASVVTGDPIATDSNFGEATVLTDETRRRVSKYVEPLLNAASIAVVPGYIGRAPDGYTTTLGRGGSDLSATALGRALGSREVWIMSDVEGILGADPALVPDAASVQHLSYREAARFASLGAKVIHPKTMEPAAAAGIEVCVRSTLDPSCPGTRVSDRELGPGVRGTALRRELSLVHIPLEEADGDVFCTLEASDFGNLKVLADGTDVAAVICVGSTTDRELVAGLQCLRVAGIRPLFAGDTHVGLLFAVAEESAEAALRALHTGLVTAAPGGQASASRARLNTSNGHGGRARRSRFLPQHQTPQNDSLGATVILGLAWGDEGKGRVCDALAADARYVARYSGGNNAGHTIRVGDEEFVVHLTPSGIVREGVICTVGNGVVVNPEVLAEEVSSLEARGIEVRGRLKVDGRAHLILPYHVRLDGYREKALGKAKIGTTNRGIGPTYEDKVARIGIRVQDVFDEGILRQKLKAALREKNSAITNVYGEEPYDPDDLAEYLFSFCDLLEPMMADTGRMLREAIGRGEPVLLEGAQATLLDNDFGTYPFVTSSNPTVGGACVGAGIPPSMLGDVVGVTKAYTTRVGDGPMPTELLDEDGETLRRVGNEYGSTTGRPRRCGWLDLVAARYSASLNGIDGLALTVLDVLSAFEEVKVCVAYEIDGQRVDELPMHQTDLHHAKPVYETLPGWGTDVTWCRRREELPREAQGFVRFVEDALGVPVRMISVGPERDQAIVERAKV